MEEDYDESESFYSEDARDDLMESDAISAGEEAFMRGYDEAESIDGAESVDDEE